MYHQAVDNVASAVISEDLKNRRAMKNNTKLPFPCHCRAVCSYSVYLKPVVTSFDKLYMEYVDVHRDFTNLFKATWTKPVIKGLDEICKPDYRPTIMFSHCQPPPEESLLPNILDPNRIRPTPVEAFIYDEKTSSVVMNRKQIGENEDTRLMILKKRLTLELEKKSFWHRIRPYIYAYKECLCLNCDYRDCIYDYRRAIRKLRDEYDLLYRKYEVLFEAEDMLPPEGDKKIIMLSGAQYEMESEIARYVEKTVYALVKPNFFRHSHMDSGFAVIIEKFSRNVRHADGIGLNKMTHYLQRSSIADSAFTNIWLIYPQIKAFFPRNISG
ncbi:unnamed protein product [Rodentolepis nana]|uniref:Uncharacterized protein n=1 Tax=Rodentolepis nana TaxID=102285 RepID=A0A3P7S5C2_RODNA|nr:unnamed protein product [Rodentolepis nana]